MRSFIRHPTSLPIRVCAGTYNAMQVSARNLSAGGLCFASDEAVKIGSKVEFWMPMLIPSYQGAGVVVWRHERESLEFEIGLRFTSDNEYFCARMVEQVCLIEDYRQRLALKGRRVSSEEAAQEWAVRYAQEFSSVDTLQLH